MLDGFADAGELLTEVASLYTRWNAASAELAELDRTAQEKLRQADLWTFQRNEIEAVNPQPGEDAQLENERRVLRNVVRLQETAGAAYAALYEDPESVAAQLRTVVKRLEELGRIDESMREVVAALEPARIAVDEATHALGHYVGKLEADPARLEEIETRLAALEKLRRKYGATIEEVIAFLEEVVAEPERRRELPANGGRRWPRKLTVLTAGYESAAGRLSTLRREAREAPGQSGRRRTGFARHGKDAG